MTRPTTRPGSEHTTLQVGAAIRCNREEKPSGALWRYEGREGWVATVNRQTFPSGVTYVEVGVTWTRPTIARHPATDVWFRSDELARR